MSKIYPGEVERMFNEDIREKKIAGYGAHKRTGKGASHAGVRGGMRTPSSIMSRKEKNEYTKPGKIEVSNVYEIINIKEFELLGDIQQKDHLIRWRDRYKNNEIAEKMGTSIATIGRLIHKFGIQSKSEKIKLMNETRKANRAKLPKEFSPEDMEILLNKCPDYESFKQLDIKQRDYIFVTMDAKYKNSTNLFSSFWNIESQLIYAIRGHVKKLYKKQEEEREKKNQVENQQIDGISADMVIVDEIKMEEPEAPQERYEAPEEKVPMSNETSHTEQSAEPRAMYSLNGTYTANQLGDKIRKVLLLIENEPNDFMINLSIHEIKSDRKDQEQNNNMVSVSELMKILGSYAGNQIRR